MRLSYPYTHSVTLITEVYSYFVCFGIADNLLTFKSTTQTYMYMDKRTLMTIKKTVLEGL